MTNQGEKVMENKRGNEIHAELVQESPISILDMARKARGPCVTKDNRIKGYSFSNQYIGKVITQQCVDKWSCQSPQFVIAPTGTGKSQLVLNEVLAMVRKNCKKLFIAASRTTLVQQYKKQVAKLEAPDLLDTLTDKGFKKTHHIGDVSIYSYQELVYLLQNNPTEFFREYGAVVLDECHFFIQDAPFNELTFETLKSILIGSQHCVRIYLTATPDICLDELIEMERRYYRKTISSIGGISHDYYNINIWHCSIYYFETGYDYINPCFFKNDAEILSIVKNDLSSAKYLICVDSKERGVNLEKSLGSAVAEYIDAEQKNNAKEEIVGDMVNNEKFNKKVLIATSFLDVGVNLKDDELVNVVVYSTDKTHFIQSIGRKRKQAQQNVSLYINIPSQEKVSKQLKTAYRKKFDLTENIERCCNSSKQYLTELPDSIYVKVINGKAELRFNSFSITYWNHRITNLKDMLESLEVIPNSDEAFGRYYLRWLGLEHLYEQAHWLSRTPDEASSEIIQMIEDYANKDLAEDKFEQFKLGFQKLYNNLFPRTKIRDDRPPHLKVLNQKFNELNLPYIASNTAKGKYLIKKG